jgi:hypothetical protein
VKKKVQKTDLRTFRFLQKSDLRTLKILAKNRFLAREDKQIFSKKPSLRYLNEKKVRVAEKKNNIKRYTN